MRSGRASIVIPAYDEEAFLGRLLESLVDSSSQRAMRVIVVCNGCTDGTEDVARGFPEVEVRVSDVAAKHAALNLGDEIAGDDYPRLYVDGDIRIDPASVLALLAALDVEAPRAVGPTVQYDFSHSPWLAGAFIRTNERLPFQEHWHATRLQGRRIYGTNRTGRARFDRFPQIRSDDGFFDLVFDDNERVVVEDASVLCPCPTSVGDLLRNQTRVTEGFHELEEWAREHRPEAQVRYRGPHGRGWRDLGLWRQSRFVGGLRHGTGLLDVLGYVAVEGLTRANAGAHRVLQIEVPWR